MQQISIDGPPESINDMEWKQMDIKKMNLHFDEFQFNCIIDKACFDANITGENYIDDA